MLPRCSHSGLCRLTHRCRPANLLLRVELLALWSFCEPGGIEDAPCAAGRAAAALPASELASRQLSEAIASLGAAPTLQPLNFLFTILCPTEGDATVDALTGDLKLISTQANILSELQIWPRLQRLRLICLTVQVQRTLLNLSATMSASGWRISAVCCPVSVFRSLVRPRTSRR